MATAEAQIYYPKHTSIWENSTIIIVQTNVTRFAKTPHNDAFLEMQIFISVNSIFLKLCSVAISMLYIANTFQVTRQDSKRSNTLALHAILWRLILHVFNYTIITCRNFNLQSWDKYHSTQYEMAILIIYSF